MKAKTVFASEQEKRVYVNTCNTEFEERLDALVKNVVSCDSEFIILSGPTCSGKTTASKKLISELYKKGKRVKTVSLDDFFRNADELKKECEGSVLDFDSEKALDASALRKFMSDIQKNGEAELPKFNFELARRTHFEHFSVIDADIVIFEGIQASYPIFTQLFEKKSKIKSIYVSVLDSLEINDTVISPREIRLWRRLVRDYKFRAASPEYSFQIWEGVVKNEDKNILPFAYKNDYMLDSLQGYGPCVLKKELTAILETVNKCSKYYEKSRSIIDAFNVIEEIDGAYLPDNSLYHEFL